jgi:hypothetical protein
MPSKWLLALILVLPFTRQALGQSSDNSAPPLGDVAKRNDAAKKEKDAPAKAKRVFTDDDMSVRKSPIPAIALQGADNTGEVLAAIHEFRANHNAEDTENAVHDWFDEQNEVLAAAIEANVRQQKHNQMRMEAAQDRSAYPYNYVYDGDSSRYNERMTTERWSQRVEARNTQENFQVISRVQQALMKVRFDVICRPNKTKPASYDWFRIRTANGVGSY